MASTSFSSIASLPPSSAAGKSSSSNSPATSGSSTAPPVAGTRKVPESEKKRIRKTAELLNVVRKFNLGDEAIEDTFDKAKGLSRKVKATIAKYGSDRNGNVIKRWNRMSIEQRNIMVKELHAAAPWLKRFEDDWGCEWVLSKGINQRATERNRSSYKEKEQERNKRLAKAVATPLEVSIETAPKVSTSRDPMATYANSEVDTSDTAPVTTAKPRVPLTAISANTISTKEPNILLPNYPHDTEEDIDNWAGLGEDSPPAFRERRASSLARELEKANQLRAELEAMLQETTETEKKRQKGKRKFNASTQAGRVATRGKPTSNKLKEALELEKESDEECEANEAKKAKKAKKAMEKKRSDKKRSKKAQNQIDKMMKD